MNNPIDESILFFLKDHSSLFYSFLNEVSFPCFSNNIKTAAVYFDSENKNFKFEINEKFWTDLNFFSKCFVISHEILHVFLKHGTRGRQYFDSLMEKDKNYKNLNIAQDISINEMLLKDFNFKISYLNFNFKPCFVDTVFNDHEISEFNISKNESFYYYYELLEKIKKENNTDDTQTIDDHDGFNSIEDKEILEENNEIKGNSDKIVNDEKKEDSNNSNSDTEDSNSDVDDFVDTFLSEHEGKLENNTTIPETTNSNFNINKEKSINEIFKLSIKTSLSLYKKNTKSNNWYGYDRRVSGILKNIDPDINLPVKSTKVKADFSRHKVLIYLDVSGSCKLYSTTFLNLIFNLPQDKYECHIYSFSDRVSSKIEVEPNSLINFENTGIATNVNSVLFHSHDILSKSKFDSIFFLTDCYFRPTAEKEYLFFKKWFFFIIPIKNSHYTGSIPIRSKHIYYLPKSLS